MATGSSGDRQITGADILVRNDGDLLTTVVDGELIGMSVEHGACYGLNGIGTRIWDLLAERRSVDDLVELLTSEFEVETTECRDQVLGFVKDLRAEGLVRVSAS